MKDDHVKALEGLIDGARLMHWDLSIVPLGETLEPIRQYLDELKVTIITMYQGRDAETFVQAVDGELTDEQKSEWRKEYFCDEFDDMEDKEDDFDVNNMLFRVVKVLVNDEIGGLLSADGGVT